MDPEPIDEPTPEREPDPELLVHRARRVFSLVEACVDVTLQSDAARARVIRLRDHLRTFVMPRAASLDAPLVALVFGPTGAGKSSLANTIAGGPVSPTGVLRPTTREAIVLATPADQQALQHGSLHELESSPIRWRSVDWQPGIAVIDSPDIDSVETANRELADRLIEAADVAVFVTTATRYADRVPWMVLRRVAERRLPLLVVVNRLPHDEEDRAEVIEDVRRLLSQAALTGADERAGLTLIPVEEGQIERPDPAVSALSRDALQPLTGRIAALRRDADARKRLAARSLAGALVGLEPLLQAVADDMDREAIDVDALRRSAESSYRGELRSLREELRSGMFLRTEVLRRWQDFVGADRLTRSISSGMTRIETGIRGAIHGGPESPATVREEARGELVAVADAHASEAARRTAAVWAGSPRGGEIVDADPALWSASSGFRDSLASAIDEWLAGIQASIDATGEPKRRLAQSAAYGVNAAGVGVMLAVFLHTGGLTGAEMGVAAGTALLNQRLLEAIFGEAAIVRLVQDASKRLDVLLGDAFDAEERRFTDGAPDGAALRQLASSLRQEGMSIAAAAKAVEGGQPWALPATDVRVEVGERHPQPEHVRPRGVFDTLRGIFFGDRVRD